MRTLMLLRVSRGLSQAELGARAGIPQPHISDFERGVRHPSHDQIVDLARALNCSTDVFRATRLTFSTSCSGAISVSS